MSDFRPCAVVPTYNHVNALDAVLSRLTARRLPVIVVDDGSSDDIGTEIRSICSLRTGVEYQRHTPNRGKGFAVLRGIACAHERGYSHAVQIDADGQHDLGALDQLLEIGRCNPDAFVTGVPKFDASVPSSRRRWRSLTTFWVRVNTLSTCISDSMCGFRVYPARATLDLARKSIRSTHMDFDVEVLVKAYWAGKDIINVPVGVTYPPGGRSNFHLVMDNLRLALLQARLFAGMLLRFPRLVMKRKRTEAGRQKANWGAMQERGILWGILVLGYVYKLFGRRICLAAMFPVVVYFFATGRQQRRCSREFLSRAWRAGYLTTRPTTLTSLRHFISFGSALLDKLAAWLGKVRLSEFEGKSIAALEEAAANPRGAFVITAHIGNPEVIRAVATVSQRAAINVLMYTENAHLFNRMIEKFSPNAKVRIVSAANVGPETAMHLAERVKRGEWVVLAADRIPTRESSRTVEVQFLNESASFPQGPFILGSILRCPAYLLFCLRSRGKYIVHFSRFADPIDIPRNGRTERLLQYVGEFARNLESRVAEAPLQWFNFYPFWAAPAEYQAMHAESRAAK